jgi:hypothetical protein
LNLKCLRRIRSFAELHNPCTYALFWRGQCDQSVTGSPSRICVSNRVAHGFLTTTPTRSPRPSAWPANGWRSISSDGVSNVGFTPKSRHSEAGQACPLCARSSPLENANISDQAARHLPDDLLTTIRVEPSSTGDPRLRGALP